MWHQARYEQCCTPTKRIKPRNFMQHSRPETCAQVLVYCVMQGTAACNYSLIIILVNCAQIQILFSADFEAYVYFQPSQHCLQNIVDFLPFSMPSCAFGAKRHDTGRSCTNNETKMLRSGVAATLHSIK